MPIAATPPVHSSSHTYTALNTWPTGPQFLSVRTTRLVMEWKDGDLQVRFEAHKVLTQLDRRAAGEPRRPNGWGRT